MHDYNMNQVKRDPGVYAEIGYSFKRLQNDSFKKPSSFIYHNAATCLRYDGSDIKSIEQQHFESQTLKEARHIEGKFSNQDNCDVPEEKLLGEEPETDMNAID